MLQHHLIPLSQSWNFQPERSHIRRPNRYISFILWFFPFLFICWSIFLVIIYFFIHTIIKQKTRLLLFRKFWIEVGWSLTVITIISKIMFQVGLWVSLLLCGSCAFWVLVVWLEITTWKIYHSSVFIRMLPLLYFWYTSSFNI